MSQKIQIEILNKVATPISTVPIVCGNADYEVEFVFDAEWEEHDVKTATFLVNGKTLLEVFSGNVCRVPVMQNTLMVEVGVFAGTIDDGTLSTSTPALVECRRSVTDGAELDIPPEDDVYNEMVKLCEEAVKTSKDVERRANEGEFNGENGKDGKPGDRGEEGKPGKDGESGLPTIVSSTAASWAGILIPYSEMKFSEPMEYLSIYGFEPNTKNPGNDMWSIVFTATDSMEFWYPVLVEWSIAEPVITKGYTYYISFIPLIDDGVDEEGYFKGKVLGVWVAKELTA